MFQQKNLQKISHNISPQKKSIIINRHKHKSFNDVFHGKLFAYIQGHWKR